MGDKYFVFLGKRGQDGWGRCHVHDWRKRGEKILHVKGAQLRWQSELQNSWTAAQRLSTVFPPKCSFFVIPWKKNGESWLALFTFLFINVFGESRSNANKDSRLWAFVYTPFCCDKEEHKLRISAAAIKTQLTRAKSSERFRDRLSWDQVRLS